MSDPLAEYFANKQKQTQVTQQGSIDPLESYFANKQSPAGQDQSFFAYFGNQLLNFAKVQMVKSDMTNPLNVLIGGYNPPLDSEQGKIKANLESQHTTFNDWVNGFEQMYNNTSESIKQAAESGSFMKDIWNGLTDMNAMAKGMFQPAADMMDMSTGMDLSGDDPHNLTPVEKATRVRNLVAFGAASAVAPGVTNVFDAGLEALGIAGTKSVALRLAEHATVGAFSGATYSGVQGQSPREVAASAFLGATIGGLIGSFGKNPKTGQIEASDAALLREMQPEKNSVASQIGVIDKSMTSDDLASVLLSGKVPLSPVHTWKIPVSVEAIPKLESNVPQGFRSALHMNEDGTGSLLVYNMEDHDIDPDAKPDLETPQFQMINRLYPQKNGSVYWNSYYQELERQKPTSQFENFFKKNGFFKGEQVTYLDKDTWGVIDRKGDHVTLESTSDGHRVDAHVKDIRSSVSTTGTTALDKVTLEGLYNQLKTYIDDGSQESEQLYLEQMNPGTHPNLLDRVPELEQLSMLKSVNSFLEGKGFNSNQVKTIRSQLQARMAEEARATYLDPEDRQMVEQATSQLTSKEKIARFTDMLKFAKANNFSISEGSGDRVILRDLQKGTVIRGFKNFEEAKNWINQSGQAVGPKLDSNPQLELSAANGGVGGLPPSGGTPVYPEDESYNHILSKRNISKFEKFTRYFPGLQGAAHLTKYRDYLLRLDSIYGSKLSDIYDNINEKYNIRNAAARPWVDRLQKTYIELASDPAAARRIMKYIEAKSPDEVASSYMQRPMNETEKAIGRRIVAEGIDMDNLFKYRRELDKLDYTYPKETRSNPKVQQAYNNDLATVRSAYQIRPSEVAMSELLDHISGMSQDDASIGAITRYARSLDDGTGKTELDRSGYAKVSGMSGKEIAAANAIEKLNADLAKVFGIGDKQLINGFMTHARLYYNGDLTKAVEDLATKADKSFYSKLSRTGEISAYEDNAFKGVLRYIKSGFDVQSGFADAISNADKIMESEFKKLPADIVDRTHNVINRMISDIRGIPSAVDEASEEHAREVLTTMGIKDPATISSWSRMIGRTYNFAALGFRQMLGIGHLGNSTGLSWAARNADYTRRVLISGAAAVRNEATLDLLKRKGVFRGISPYSAFSPELDYTTYAGKVGKIYNKTQELAFKSTLLPTVYDGTVAGHYLTTSQDVLEAAKIRGDALKELAGSGSKADIDKLNKQFAKKVFLSKYDLPVQKKFLALADKNPEEAAHYLGMQAVEDLVGTYGRGNTPFGWGGTFGSLAGQYGNFSRFIWGSLTRIATRGTIGERLASVAKLYAIHKLWQKASDETGLDLTRMDPMHAMWWIGGPLVHETEDIVTAIHGDGVEQALAESRLKRQAQFWNNPSLFVPGSFAVSGLTQAFEDASQGNYLQAAGQAIGFRRNIPR